MKLPSSITPVKAQHILSQKGMQVSVEQAAAILEFLVKLANSSIKASRIAAAIGHVPTNGIGTKVGL